VILARIFIEGEVEKVVAAGADEDDVLTAPSMAAAAVECLV